MSTDLSQMSSWFDDDALNLPPIKSKKHPEGKSYRIDSPDFGTGLLLQQLASIATRISNGVEVTEAEAKRLKMDDQEERDFSQMVLGDSLGEMVADGVPWGPIRRVTQYAFTYYALSPEQAEKLIAPKAPANRAERRKKSKKK